MKHLNLTALLFLALTVALWWSIWLEQYLVAGIVLITLAVAVEIGYQHNKRHGGYN